MNKFQYEGLGWDAGGGQENEGGKGQKKVPDEVLLKIAEIAKIKYPSQTWEGHLRNDLIEEMKCAYLQEEYVQQLAASSLKFPSQNQIDEAVYKYGGNIPAECSGVRSGINWLRQWLQSQPQQSQWSYCQRQIEGHQYCAVQCEQCQKYYAPLEQNSQRSPAPSGVSKEEENKTADPEEGGYVTDQIIRPTPPISKVFDAVDGNRDSHLEMVYADLANAHREIADLKKQLAESKPTAEGNSIIANARGETIIELKKALDTLNASTATVIKNQDRKIVKLRNEISDLKVINKNQKG